MQPHEETSQDILERVRKDTQELSLIKLILEEWTDEHQKANKKYKKAVKEHLNFISSGLGYLQSIKDKVEDFENKAREVKPCANVVSIDSQKEEDE